MKQHNHNTDMDISLKNIQKEYFKRQRNDIIFKQFIALLKFHINFKLQTYCVMIPCKSSLQILPFYTKVMDGHIATQSL